MKYSLIAVAAAASVSGFSLGGRFSQAVSKVRSIFSLRDDTCYKANTNDKCTGFANCPPCWVRNGNKYDCYDYGKDGKCPFGEDKKKSGSKYPAPTCYKANNAANICQASTGTCPPCWVMNGGKYDCYDYQYGSSCPWGIQDVTKN